MNYLQIFGYEAEGNGPAETSFSDQPFEAQLNPSSLKMNHSINYNGGNTEDTNNSDAVSQQRFTGVPPQTLSFELIIDNSGALPEDKALSGSVLDKIEEFKTTCYFYRGSNHETPYVQLLWNGTSLFKYKDQAYFARLKSFDVNYTLFSSEGEPLRAKINASFVGTMDPQTQARIKDNQSPDLTHVITVKAGDTLPMLCEKIYGSRQMFHEVARVNNLLSFRYIKPGTELVFPPIK
jgi:LysM repeat protein